MTQTELILEKPLLLVFRTNGKHYLCLSKKESMKLGGIA